MSPHKLRNTVLSLFLTAAGLLSCGPAGAGALTPAPLSPSAVDSLVAGAIADLPAGTSGAVIVNVWASWCDPCKEELPSLIRLADEHENLRLILISADDPDDLAPAVIPTLDTLGVDFPSYILAGDQTDLMNALHSDWSGALPATFIYDRAGSLSDWFIGGRTYDQFASTLRPLLGD